MKKRYSSDATEKLLKRAQDTYGYRNQVSVAIEECCELGQILSKYVRYPSHLEASEKLRDQIIEEVADVTVCMIHLRTIFKIQPEELLSAMDIKLERLERWLDSSNDMYQTTIDRGLSKDATGDKKI